jgi:hypothetical protein
MGLLDLILPFDRKSFEDAGRGVVSVDICPLTYSYWVIPERTEPPASHLREAADQAPSSVS